MTTKPKTDTAKNEIEAVLSFAADQTAPMVRRLDTHRDRVAVEIKALEGERFEIQSRRDVLRRQVEAVEQGFAIHLADIDETLALYERGLNGLPADGSKAIE